MNSYEVLERAIPKKQSERVAKILSISTSYVQRWRREPVSDEAPLSSGQRSILDRICDLMDAIFLVNPAGVALIVEFVNKHYANLVDTHATILDTPKECAKESAALLKEATEAINKLSVDGCDAETIMELVDLRDETEKAIARVRKTIREKAQLEN